MMQEPNYQQLLLWSSNRGRRSTTQPSDNYKTSFWIGWLSKVFWLSLDGFCRFAKKWEKRNIMGQWEWLLPLLCYFHSRLFTVLVTPIKWTTHKHTTTDTRRGRRTEKIRNKRHQRNHITINNCKEKTAVPMGNCRQSASIRYVSVGMTGVPKCSIQSHEVSRSFYRCFSYFLGNAVGDVKLKF